MLTEKQFNTGSSIINYVEGPPSGPPVVFLHGLTDRWQFFLPIHPFLSNRWNVYALDFREHGKSSRSPPYRYIEHMNDVVKFIEGVLTEKPIIFGASLGGNIALMAASKHPGLARAVYTGLRQTPEAIARIALDEDADVIALPSMAGSHLPVCRRLKPLLEQAGLHDKLWIIGGNLPAQDHEALRALGFERAEPPLPAGMSGGARLWKAFRQRLAGYAEERDFPALARLRGCPCTCASARFPFVSSCAAPGNCPARVPGRGCRSSSAGVLLRDPRRTPGRGRPRVPARIRCRAVGR